VTDKLASGIQKPRLSQGKKKGGEGLYVLIVYFES
jgi:hypothetical protein